MAKKIKNRLLVFSGGRGNKNLFFHMKNQTKDFQELSVIINGLDDGASTGEIRRLFNYKAHGISDFLKAILSLSPDKNLIKAMDARFPYVNNFEERLLLYRNLHRILYKDFLPKYFKPLASLSKRKRKLIVEKLHTFFNYFYINREEIIDIEDFKIGNILFASFLIENNLDFNKAIGAFSNFCSLDPKIKIYPNSNSVRYLSGLLKNGTLLPNEASVVLTRTTHSIKDIYQMENPITMNQIRKLSSIEIDDKINYLETLRSYPKCNEAIEEKIVNADIIIYGSGTPYSSILPSLETKDISRFINENNAPKVMIANLKKETNNFVNVSDLVEDLFKHLSRSVTKKINKKDLLTHLIVNDNVDDNFSDQSITFDADNLKKKYSWLKVIKGNFADKSNPSAHNGAKVFEALVSIINE
tara:strand:- start:828 stop:2069 length:1242 start_codon:yes stop_codon:yes gene_type:complete